MIYLLNKTIAQQIRIYRNSKKMTLSELSNTTGIDETYIARVERNELNITLNTLEKIITGLGMNETEFFSFLVLENGDPELSQVMKEVKYSNKKKQLIKVIKDVIELSD